MITDYNRFVEVITNLVKEIKLTQVKASGTNGKKISTLYSKYKQTRSVSAVLQLFR